MASKLLASTALAAPERRIFERLAELGPFLVTGGWVRDKVLSVCDDVNPVAAAAWSRRRRLSGCPEGDLDVIVEGVSVRDFHQACRNLSLRTVLVPAKKDRSLDVLKLKAEGMELDITSFVDAQRRLGLGVELPSGFSDGLLRLDAEHRDVAFNALYYRFGGEEVLDPTGQGLLDLSQSEVRIPHGDSALASCREDPLRLLRAMRFAARFDFRLHDSLLCPDTVTTVRALLADVSHGRVLNELKKGLLLHNGPHRFLKALGGPGQLHQLFFAEGARKTPVTWWSQAVANVGRLESLVLEGSERGHLDLKSVMWRGRNTKDAAASPPVLLKRSKVAEPPLRIEENDWAELLLAALLHPGGATALETVRLRFEISAGMLGNVVQLLEKVGRSEMLGPRLLAAAFAGNGSAATSAAFWNGVAE